MSTKPFVPSMQAMQNTLGSYPGGAVELHLVSAHLTKDIEIDTRVAASGVQPDPHACLVPQSEQDKYPFYVPLRR